MNQHGVRSKYSPRIGIVVETGDESPTQQHFKDQCDINKIARSIEATGSSEHVKQARERYGDFTELFDVGTNFDRAAKAEQLFQQVPVELRKRVGHTIPGLFEFIQKQENFEDCVKFGIFDKPAEPSAPVAAAEPAPQATKSGAMKKPKVQAPPADNEE